MRKYWRVTNEDMDADSEIFLTEVDAAVYVRFATECDLKVEEVTEMELSDDELLDAHGLVELDTTDQDDCQLVLRLVKLLSGL